MLPDFDRYCIHLPGGMRQTAEDYLMVEGQFADRQRVCQVGEHICCPADHSDCTNEGLSREFPQLWDAIMVQLKQWASSQMSGLDREQLEKDLSFMVDELRQRLACDCGRSCTSKCRCSERYRYREGKAHSASRQKNARKRKAADMDDGIEPCDPLAIFTDGKCTFWCH